MDKGILADWINSVVDDAVDAHSELNCGNNPHDEFAQGKSLALYGVITSLQNIVKIHYPDDLGELGLDFDADARFLSGTGEIVPISKAYIQKSA
ncbi:MAG: hypothetical protein FWB96_11865 [Defluviitaleaceae bacterium]|nr:hypothetical protein [Defluviitaleaceae bacterium]MCL2263784.1 hypothetical protein [Defluviitaleaceae bacterium]